MFRCDDVTKRWRVALCGRMTITCLLAFGACHTATNAPQTLDTASGLVSAQRSKVAVPSFGTPPQYHHQWLPDTLLVEKPGFAPPLAQSLKEMGYHIEVGEIGCKVQAIAYEEGRLHGVSDPRGEGLAAGEQPIPAGAAAQPADHQDISHD